MASDPAITVYDIIIPQGATWRDTFWYGELTDPDDEDTFEPYDITGWTAKGQVRDKKSKSGALLGEMDFTINGLLGEVNAELTATDSDAIEKSGYYDIELTSPDGEVVRLSQGKAILDTAVTD